MECPTYKNIPNEFERNLKVRSLNKLFQETKDSTNCEFLDQNSWQKKLDKEIWFENVIAFQTLGP